MKAKDKAKRTTKKQVKANQVKCWEVFKCEEKECPAYESKDLTCWLFSGTRCHDEIQAKFMEKIELCLDCKVFKKNMDLSAIKKTLDTLIKQIKVFKELITDSANEGKTYEKRLERISTEWRATFDSLPYGVMLLDSNLHFIRANKYIAELTGIPLAELRDRDCYDLLYKPHLPIDGISKIEPSASFTTKPLEFLDTKSNKHFALYVSPIHDERGAVISYVHSLVDITDNKTQEKQVIESRDAFLNMLKDLDVSYKELKEVYQGLIVSFVNALDAKSPWTKGHSVRVTRYAVATAKELGLKESDTEPLNTAALLHDIGKIGTYDTVLDKPGKLTDEEFALVKMHPGKGADILSPVRQFQPILPIIRHHHERLDGRGYPDGLKGDEIPFLARIIHVADSFDAMTADRPYRKAPGREYAISELKKHSGQQFDPDAAEAFIRYLERTPEEKKRGGDEAA